MLIYELIYEYSQKSNYPCIATKYRLPPPKVPSGSWHEPDPVIHFTRILDISANHVTHGHVTFSISRWPEKTAPLFSIAMLETTELKQMAFPPDVLARIAPDISLQRHLAIGLRPSLRNFHEFKANAVSTGTLNKIAGGGNNTIIGSSIVKNGPTTIICGITMGVVEKSASDSLLSSATAAQYTSIYPVVDIVRGRSGAPTDEEMIISQRLYETILHSKLISQASLNISPGYQIASEEDGSSRIVYPEKEEDYELLNASTYNTSKRFSFVLYAHLKVFSRAGPLFDACHNALVSALHNVKFPRIYVNSDFDIKVPVRSRGNFGHLSNSSNNLKIDINEALLYPIELRAEETGYSSSFGLIDLEDDANIDENKTVLLADLEGDAEEACTSSKINVIANRSGEYLKSVSISGGGSNVTLEVLKKSIDLAKARSTM